VAEAALAAGVRDPVLREDWADTEDLRTAPATVFVYRASLAQARGDVPATVRHARRALELAAPEDHVVRGGAGGFLGLAAWAAGDVDEAKSAFGEAVRSLHAAGNLVDELDTTVVLGDMWVASGLPSRARRLYEQALDTATRGGQPYPRATADLHVGLAELDREADDLAGAEAHLEAARVLTERGSITENRHRWYVARAQLHAAQGDTGIALGRLDEAEALYRPGFYPDLRPIPAIRARLQLAAADLGGAAAWAEDAGVRVEDDPAYLREYEHLTLARLLIAQQSTGAPGTAGAALDLLDRWEAAAAEAARPGSLFEIRVLRALAHFVDGDPGAALAALDRAFAGALEPDAYVRLFLDEGAAMLDLLRQAAAADGPAVGAARDHARRLLEGAPHAAPPPAAGDSGLPDPLSQRELEVLRLLETELTGPQIARELYVSLNTLRTHTKRIFTKLDATTRAGAVRRARDRGIL
jgi:LuxR family maltose regulon positive regulatory protein